MTYSVVLKLLDCIIIIDTIILHIHTNNVYLYDTYTHTYRQEAGRTLNDTNFITTRLYREFAYGMCHIYRRRMQYNCV
jgi:hypothetical protein